MCAYYKPDIRECPIEEEVFKAFTFHLRDTYNLDPINDETLIKYYGMIEVLIDSNRRLGKSIKTLEAQKNAFIEALDANTDQSLSGISRAKAGVIVAFSELMKKEKDALFWRLIIPDIKKVLPNNPFTIEDVLEWEFPNLKGKKLTQKDDFVKTILQNALEELIDEGLIKATKKEGKIVYSPAE